MPVSTRRSKVGSTALPTTPSPPTMTPVKQKPSIMKALTSAISGKVTKAPAKARTDRNKKRSAAIADGVASTESVIADEHSTFVPLPPASAKSQSATAVTSSMAPIAEPMFTSTSVPVRFPMAAAPATSSMEATEVPLFKTRSGRSVKRPLKLEDEDDAQPPSAKKLKTLMGKQIVAAQTPVTASTEELVAAPVATSPLTPTAGLRNVSAVEPAARKIRLKLNVSQNKAPAFSIPTTKAPDVELPSIPDLNVELASLKAPDALAKGKKGTTKKGKNASGVVDSTPDTALATSSSTAFITANLASPAVDEPTRTLERTPAKKQAASKKKVEPKKPALSKKPAAAKEKTVPKNQPAPKLQPASKKQAASKKDVTKDTQMTPIAETVEASAPVLPSDPNPQARVVLPPYAWSEHGSSDYAYERGGDDTAEAQDNDAWFSERGRLIARKRGEPEPPTALPPAFYFPSGFANAKPGPPAARSNAWDIAM